MTADEFPIVDPRPEPPHLHRWRPNGYDRILCVEVYVCQCGAHGYQRHTGGPIIEGEADA